MSTSLGIYIFWRMVLIKNLLKFGVILSQEVAARYTGTMVLMEVCDKCFGAGEKLQLSLF